MQYLDFVQLNVFQKFFYKIGKSIKNFFVGLLSFFIHLPYNIYLLFASLGKTVIFDVKSFIHGDIKTRLSYIIMGFSNFARGQIIKGLLFLIAEASFILYMTDGGWNAITGLLKLGTQKQHILIIEGQVPKLVAGDNSMLMLLYGVLAIFTVAVIIAIYFANISAAVKAQKVQESGRKLPNFKTEMQAYLDEKFHTTLLIIPIIGIIFLTILPLIFMILIAFTNYDSYHQPPGNLFTWTGLRSFQILFGASSASGLVGQTFVPVLEWTLIWAVLSTISNYILGMLLAMLINKKGVRCKKFFRTIFILSIAIPQFVSLLIFRNMLDDHGPINALLLQLNVIHNFIPFLSNPLMARATVLFVNLWVGVPYTMLITTGILMNIPSDLYEAAKIDGASPFKVYTKITLPYVLFITTPYLITQFIGNLNNFNIIYLLTGGGPATLSYYQAGKTDLLVTWLYNLTLNTRDYCFASAIGIFVFILSAIFSLIAFRNSASYKNEEGFQ